MKTKTKNKEHLFSITKKDFEIQTFKCTGPGGQKVNKTNSGVRIKHKDSGAVSESRTARTQFQNKKLAFKRLTNSPIFKLWIQKKAFEVTEGPKKIKEQVDKMMHEDNLLIETKDGGKWKNMK